MEEKLTSQRSNAGALAWICGARGAVGGGRIYGLVAYAWRMAMGVDPQKLMRMMLRQALLLAWCWEWRERWGCRGC